MQPHWKQSVVWKAINKYILIITVWYAHNSHTYIYTKPLLSMGVLCPHPPFEKWGTKGAEAPLLPIPPPLRTINIRMYIYTLLLGRKVKSSLAYSFPLCTLRGYSNYECRETTTCTSVYILNCWPAKSATDASLLQHICMMVAAGVWTMQTFCLGWFSAIT